MADIAGAESSEKEEEDNIRCDDEGTFCTFCVLCLCVLCVVVCEVVGVCEGVTHTPIAQNTHTHTHVARWSRTGFQVSVD